MKRRVGVALEAELLRRAKRAVVREKKTLSLLLEEALREHIARLEARVSVRGKSLVEETRGVLRVSKKLLDAVLADETFHETG